MHKLPWLAVLVAALALAGCSGAEPNPTPTSPCDDTSFTDVSFRNAAGELLHGYVAGAGPVAVVLGNQTGKQKCSWKPFVHMLTDQGYRVLAFDYAEDSGGKGALDGDTKAAVEYVRKSGSQRAVLIGASRGATAALATASSINPPVTAVISLSASPVYRDVDALSGVATIAVPVLFIAAVGDTQYKEFTMALYQAATRAEKEFYIVGSSSAHGEDLPLGGDATSTVNVTIFNFLSKYTKA
jgi:pimeloyl-ACP methyl ester carboxylesterase